MIPETFWNKVEKTDSCWNWTACTRNGYGAFRFQSQDHYAHRFIYQNLIEEIPTGFFVLHSCDNPRCVNPEHLRLGTPKDNVDDMYARNRASRGRKHRESYKLSGKRGRRPSKYIGVSWDGRSWRAHIRINGKQRSLGHFKSEDEAHRAYLNAIPEDTNFQVQFRTESYR